MKRDGRINLRVPSHQKVQWEAWSRDAGYQNLTLFIEDAVAAFGDTLRERPALEDRPPDAIVNVPDTTQVFQTLSQKLIAQKQETVPGSDPTVCPNAGFHRRGVFCKSCKRVIQKG